MAMDKKKAEQEAAIAARENELSEKEAAANKRKEEIAGLEETVRDFPDKLEKTVAEASQETAENLQKEFAAEKRLLEQEWKGEQNMLVAKINSLQETIKTQALEIKSLKDSLSVANQHAQTLAATVIESVSGAKQAKMTEGNREASKK